MQHWLVLKKKLSRSECKRSNKCNKYMYLLYMFIIKKTRSSWLFIDCFDLLEKKSSMSIYVGKNIKIQSDTLKKS